MTSRTTWKFPYAANEILAAATKKLEYHTERLDWWSTKKDEVIATIRSEGIEVDQSLSATANNNPQVWTGKFSNSYKQETVSIREDLQNNMQECHAKIMEHRTKKHEFDGWVQVLTSQGTSLFELNQDDWLFFFGR